MSPTSGPSRAISLLAIRTGSWSPPKAGNERMRLSVACSVFGVALSLTAVAMTAAEADTTFRIPGAHAEALTFAALNGWHADDHAAAFGSFLKSCKAILGSTPAQRAARPIYG